MDSMNLKHVLQRHTISSCDLSFELPQLTALFSPKYIENLEIFIYMTFPIENISGSKKLARSLGACISLGTVPIDKPVLSTTLNYGRVDGRT